MTKDEVMARMARDLYRAKQRAKLAEQAISRARQLLFRIGGPLNDNALRYSKEQLTTFHRIDDVLAGFGS